jgi:hypothetical protein
MTASRCMRVLLCACALLVSACALQPKALPAMPVLLLRPQALDRPLALQQRLTVTAAGRTLQVEMALEADHDGVRMVLLDLGQAVARLEWDGRELTERRGQGLPAHVRTERILGDVQLVHWPAEAIQSALPLGWTLTASTTERTLRHEGRPVLRVRYPAHQVAELENLAEGYTVRVESRQMEMQR